MGGKSHALEAVSEPPAAELGAERFILHSERIGRDFQVTVSRPSAAPFVPGQAFPAIYVLDGGDGVAGPLATLLGRAGAMSPALVVSVGYLPGAGEHRSHDLTHNPSRHDDGTPFGGGGAAFQGFLTHDLRPFIERRYPADPARAGLFGHSLGGLFATNVLASDSGAFSDYVIASPSIWADPDAVDRVERVIRKVRGGRMYLAVGSHEDRFDIHNRKAHMLLGFARLDAALRRNPRIVLQTRIWPDEGHLSVCSRIYDDAFRFVLPPKRPLTAPRPKPRLKALTRYAGAYALPDGRLVTVSCSAVGQVTARVADGPEAPLVHVGGRRFYSPATDLDVVFDAAGFTLTAGNGATWRGVRDASDAPALEAATA